MVPNTIPATASIEDKVATPTNEAANGESVAAAALAPVDKKAAKQTESAAAPALAPAAAR